MNAADDNDRPVILIAFCFGLIVGAAVMFAVPLVGGYCLALTAGVVTFGAVVRMGRR